jgi:hypothetical protein
MIDVPGLKTMFSCHHPLSARWTDVWIEGCRECCELRFSRDYHLEKGWPWNEYWPPVHRVQVVFEGEVRTYSLNGGIVSRRDLSDMLLDLNELDAALLFDVQRAADAYRKAQARRASKAELSLARQVVIGALLELVDVVPASYLPIAEDDTIMEVA